ncbi:MoaD/ThiS family protein [Frigoriflavimonas asaccharolytica]|uniref:Molybdopterin synthase sulfur carrier subunit n=1 Tax=Frigoriflavimonas asaccharolytica TaxID=2735899 RepID=A0A8J8G754_9FLAO|nr:MoaD/ThiS family protein [Frigoriflavimonas asaccharolytica]NRS91212.1 molybdopterin synthase sulfur carrier subunit [Frigoriflavimonas asaccharolytica]
MTITAKYFGLIADFTKEIEEEFTIEKSDFSTEDLLNDLKQKYSELQETSFVIAVNKNITSENLNLKNNDIIALLPPFAGG